MSEVEFYRDHIAGLRSQLILRDLKIEKLEAAVTRGIKLRAAVEEIQRRLIAVDWQVNAELSAIIDDLAKITNGSEEP